VLRGRYLATLREILIAWGTEDEQIATSASAPSARRARAPLVIRAPFSEARLREYFGGTARSCSIRSSWLYLATRCCVAGAPALDLAQFVPKKPQGGNGGVSVSRLRCDMSRVYAPRAATPSCRASSVNDPDLIDLESY